MDDDELLNSALEKLVMAAAENVKLRNENSKLKKRLFEEVARYEQKKNEK